MRNWLCFHFKGMISLSRGMICYLLYREEGLLVTKNAVSGIRTITQFGPVTYSSVILHKLLNHLKQFCHI